MSEQILSREGFEQFWTQAENDKEYSLLVTGTSMYPFLVDNRSVVFIEKKDRYDVRRGDILFYRRLDGAMILHRVLKCLNSGKYVMNGDSQQYVEIIDESQICAKVTNRYIRKKHVINVKSIPYRVCVFIWQILLPVRRWIFKAGHIVKGLMK